jgi:hypothetical protein
MTLIPAIVGVYVLISALIHMARERRQEVNINRRPRVYLGRAYERGR